jgi:DNA-binding XRE family transcriptional regulator
MSDVVTIKLAEYEKLKTAAEDLADILAYDRAMANPVESVPAEYVKRIIDGESPLRVFRDWRGLTQSELSNRSGVNRVQIGDIEAGRKKGSVGTLKKLADALSVSVDDLI